MELRIKEHSNNALEVANYLQTKNIVSRTIYPSLTTHPQNKIANKQMKAGGGVVSFELKGSKDKVFKFLNKLQIIKISNNLGDTKSLICHPATTTHQRLSDGEKLEVGITQNLIRLSVGLENVNDLIDDLEYALDS